MSFTGVNDCDISIFLFLGSKDLINVSLVDTSTYALCRSDSFWFWRVYRDERDPIIELDELCELDNVVMFMKYLSTHEKSWPEWSRSLLEDYLDYAVECKSWRIFDHLIDNVQFTGYEIGCTNALAHYIDTSNFSRFEMLIQKGCEPIDWILNSALANPVVDISTIQLIISKGGLPSHHPCIWPALVYAMRGGNLEIIKLILELSQPQHIRLVFGYPGHQGRHLYELQDEMEVDEKIFNHTREMAYAPMWL